jgi:hypothetical protein
MQSEKAEQFYAVARRPFEQEVFEILALFIYSRHAAQFRYQETERHFHHDAVERRTADARGQKDGADLAQQSAGERAQRSNQPFGQRKDELITHLGTQFAVSRLFIL